MAQPRRIDRLAVLDAALVIADEEGLEAVTMHRVAKELGVTPMALYRHVGDKAGLVDGMLHHMLLELPPPAVELPWRDRVRSIAHSIRHLGFDHPNLVILLMGTSDSGLPGSLIRDRVIGAIRWGGLSWQQAMPVERVISTAIVGFVVSESTGRFRSGTFRDLDKDFEAVLSMVDLYLDDVMAAMEADGGLTPVDDT